MSTFQYSIQIGNQSREMFEVLDAWVDTGASYTLIPKDIMERLGHVPTHHRPFRLADGNTVELGLCQAPLRIGEETVMVSCVFGDDRSEALLGATALEELGLGVDPVNHTLIPIVLNLLGFNQE